MGLGTPGRGSKPGRMRRPRRRNGGSERGIWFLGTLALAVAIAGIDYGLGSGSNSTGLLCVPAVAAGMRVGFRRTLQVALFSIVLALALLGLDGELITQDHVGQLVIVTIPSFLSVWGARAMEEAAAAESGGAMLAEGMELLEEGLQVDALAARLARVPVPDLASVCLVHLLDDGALALAALAAEDGELERSLEAQLAPIRIDRLSSHPIAEAARMGQHRAFKFVTAPRMRHLAGNEPELEAIRKAAPRSALILPLADGREIVGALSLWSRDDGDRFGPEAMALAQELSRRAAAGIVNARMHEQQVRLVHALQESLLPPSLPEIEGLEIATRFRPAGSGNQVGGDFYDLFPLDDLSWGVVIGDVCGKGPEAAALTALMRDTVRVAGIRRETPCGALTLLNRAILDSKSEGRFCTSAYARLDLNGTGKLTVCNAGHPPPAMLGSDGSVSRVGPPGTLLGIYDDVELDDTTVPFDPGDMLVLFTDGLFEARPSVQVRPVDVDAIVGACRGLSAETAVQALEAEARAAQGGDTQDDIAIVVIKRI